MKKIAVLFLVLALCAPPEIYAYKIFGGGYKEQVDAKDIDTDTSNFNGNLSSIDKTVQKALDTLDDMEGGSGSMVYPGAGIPLSTGSAWGTSITNNSSNWNTAYGWGNHASAGYVTGTPWTSAGYELASNKVTSVSSGSTDTQYPSAKLLYDQLAGKQASGSYLTSLSGALLATGATTGATSQPQPFTDGYASTEYDIGNVATNQAVNWALGNTQYCTMTADTTFTFSGAISGQVLKLDLAGAYTPTLPTTVRYSGGTTPTWTKTAGKKDKVVCSYSAKESLYDCAVTTSYATT